MARAHHLKWRRLKRAAELLSAKPYTSRDLLEALRQDSQDDGDLKPRTVQRLLKDMGAVQDVSRYPPVYHLLEERLRPVEALITHSMLRMLYHHTPGPNAVYFEILRKLARQLPEPAQSVALRSTEDLRRREGALTDEGEKLSQVAEAWFERRAIAFDYLTPSGSGKPRHNELEVYFVEISRANLGVYVIGFEKSFHQAVRTYKLNRMRRIRVLGDPDAYEMPQTFDPRAYLSTAWGVIGTSGGETADVRLRFKPEAAYRILEGNFPNVKVGRKHPDGSLEVAVTVGTTNDNFPLELLSWVQSWGPRVEVLEPERLRERWLAEARAVAGMGE